MPSGVLCTAPIWIHFIFTAFQWYPIRLVLSVFFSEWGSRAMKRSLVSPRPQLVLDMMGARSHMQITLFQWLELLRNNLPGGQVAVDRKLGWLLNCGSFYLKRTRLLCPLPRSCWGGGFEFCCFLVILLCPSKEGPVEKSHSQTRALKR